MKRHGIFFILLCALFLGFDSQTQNAGSRNFAHAIEQAHKLVNCLQLTPEELQHTIEFIEFYASWYAPVTPAPYVLREALAPEACDFINTLKTVARPFERTTPTRRMGASRLTPEGKLFYQEVLIMLKDIQNDDLISGEKRCARESIEGEVLG